jgi:hypothetical protein
MPSVVTISRMWNNPSIKTTITTDGISLDISLDDYLEALVNEIGSVTFTINNAKFKDKVKEASNRVINGVKLESTKVIISGVK